MLRVEASDGADEFEAVGDGADRAAAAPGDIGDGQLLKTVEPKNSESGWRFEGRMGIDPVEELKQGRGVDCGGRLGCRVHNFLISG